MAVLGSVFDEEDVGDVQECTNFDPSTCEIGRDPCVGADAANCHTRMSLSRSTLPTVRKRHGWVY